jgi:hypothetical protein
MALSTHFNRTVVVKRLSDDSGNTEIYDTHIASLPCLIQPLDDSYNQDVEGSFGKDSLLMCGVVDILEGDRVIDGSNSYRVVAVELMEFLEAPHHTECRIRLFNP